MNQLKNWLQWERFDWTAFVAIIALAIACLLSSCVVNPGVTITTPDGTKTKFTTGTNLMAEVDEQVSEVEAPGYHIRHMVKRQDATRVAIAALQTAGVAFAGWTAASVQKAMEITKQLQAGEITKQQAQKSLETIALAELAKKSGDVKTAAGAGAEFLPVQVTP